MTVYYVISPPPPPPPIPVFETVFDSPVHGILVETISCVFGHLRTRLNLRHFCTKIIHSVNCETRSYFCRDTFTGIPGRTLQPGLVCECVHEHTYSFQGRHYVITHMFTIHIRFFYLTNYSTSMLLTIIWVLVASLWEIAQWAC